MILIEVSILVTLIYGIVFSAAVEFNLAANQHFDSNNNKVAVKGSTDTKFVTRASVKSAEHHGELSKYFYFILSFKEQIFNCLRLIRETLARVSSSTLSL